MREIRPPEIGESGGIFLAGGITNCPDWQRDVVYLLSRDEGLLYNPRRENFQDADAIPQIEWEFEHLKKADGILFWFPKETVCPITLYELGRWAAQMKPIFVGCHPEYSRKLDLKVQLRLARGPLFPVYESLFGVVDSAREFFGTK